MKQLGAKTNENPFRHTYGQPAKRSRNGERKCENSEKEKTKLINVTLEYV